MKRYTAPKYKTMAIVRTRSKTAGLTLKQLKDRSINLPFSPID